MIREVILSGPGRLIDGKFIFRFDAFRKLFEIKNFIGTLEVEKACLYRECFCVGGGNISPEIFFTVCCETNFFVKFLKIRMNHETLKFK